MKPRSATLRKTTDKAMRVLSACAALAGIIVLALILGVVVQRGVAAINWGFFVNPIKPPYTPGGGIGNALLGSFLIVTVAVALGVPTGLLAGTYLAEFGRGTRLGSFIRFCANVMMGLPSIIVGLFVYTAMVVPMGQSSGWAGGVALAILMMPVVARTTEDMLGLVPNSLRESALALGAPRWKVTVNVVFRAAKSGLLTGVLLAGARVSGETAPLLFTAQNSPYWPKSLNGPTANLTVTIYKCGMTPFADWIQMAWGASLVITVAVLALNLSSRYILKRGLRA